MTNVLCTYSILNGVKIAHNIAPINLHSSINVTGVSECANVCPSLSDLGQPIFRSIVAVANSTIPILWHFYNHYFDIIIIIFVTRRLLRCYWANVFSMQIYLNSSELFLLEERIHELEKQVLSLDENSACGTINELEDKVALTVAMVSHRDDQVCVYLLHFI